MSETRKDDQAIKAAAKAAKGPDKSGRGLSSTARMMLALSETVALTQKAGQKLDPEAKKVVTEALTAEAHAAQAKQTIKDNPSTELDDWEITTREIITQLSNERKTQATAEELDGKFQDIAKRNQGLLQGRNKAFEQVEKVIEELHTIIPDLVKKLKSGQLGDSERQKNIEKIRELGKQAETTLSDFEKIYFQEGGNVKELRQLYTHSVDTARSASITINTDNTPKPQDL